MGDKTKRRSDLAVGDILEFERKLVFFTYYHCGIYAGNNTVIHMGTAHSVGGLQAFKAKWNNDIMLRSDDIQDVAHGSNVYVNNWLDSSHRPRSQEELILGAWAMFGEAKARYHIVLYNCQHVCTKLRNGVAISRQIENLKRWNFFTSSQRDYTKYMVKVDLNDGDLNFATSSMINKSIRKKNDKCVHKDRLKFPDKEKPLENKAIFLMTSNGTNNNFTSNFDCQPNKRVCILNTGRYTIPLKKPKYRNLTKPTYWNLKKPKYLNLKKPKYRNLKKSKYRYLKKKTNARNNNKQL